MKKRSAEITPIPGQDYSEDRQFIASLHKGLDVLRNMAHVNRPLGNKELSDLTGFPKATVSRITYTLSRLGYLRYLSDSGKYVLGLPVLGLGYACLAGLNFTEAARPLMQKLADDANAMVALGSRDQFSMLYVAESHSRGPLSLQLRAGSRISMVRSSMGRAYLAGLPENERLMLFDALARHTGEKWPLYQAQIEAAVQEIRERGFCCNFGDWYPEVNSVGVPFVPADGSPPMAFTCGAANFILDEQKAREEIGPRLVEMVASINRG
jgi:DNA-binding IclR family transcriptional regulator